MSSIRRFVVGGAIVAMVAYAVIRTIIVWTSLATYGVNPWIFLFIDCSTAVVYVIAIERLIAGLRPSKKLAIWQLVVWALVAAATFIAPYAYVYSAAQELPAGWLLGIVVIAVLLGANAFRNTQKRIRGVRKVL